MAAVVSVMDVRVTISMINTATATEFANLPRFCAGMKKMKTKLI